MRTIAFRAWDTKNKRMEYKPKIAVPLNPFPLNDIFFQLDTVWMQNTGLSDRNGKEIYEGDIIQAHPHYDGDKVGIGVVIYEPENISFIIEERGATPKWTFNGPEGTNWMQNYIEVIGNCFENPELLK